MLSERMVLMKQSYSIVTICQVEERSHDTMVRRRMYLSVVMCSRNNPGLLSTSELVLVIIYSE